MWELPLPVAEIPLWQDAHVPVTEEWSKLIEVQPLVLWQSSQVLAEAMCDGPLPVAAIPL